MRELDHDARNTESQSKDRGKQSQYNQKRGIRETGNTQGTTGRS